MKLAFYKGTRPGLAGLYNRAVRWVTQQQYSHVEVLFADGRSASSSFMDGGVRIKTIDYGTPANWDFIALDDSYDEGAVRWWFVEHLGQGYDLFGALHFLIGIIPDRPRKWFCSEAVAAALVVANPKMYHPGTLAALGWRRRAVQQVSAGVVWARPEGAANESGP